MPSKYHESVRGVVEGLLGAGLAVLAILTVLAGLAI